MTHVWAILSTTFLSVLLYMLLHSLISANDTVPITNHIVVFYTSTYKKLVGFRCQTINT